MSAIRECINAIATRPGWSLPKLADELGLHYETLRRYRSGKQPHLNFDVVAKLFIMDGRSLDAAIGIPTNSAAGSDVELLRKLELKDQTIDALSTAVKLLSQGAPSPAVVEADDTGGIEEPMRRRTELDVARESRGAARKEVEESIEEMKDRAPAQTERKRKAQ